jgi:archaellum component FlaF (FlaF/FlaG flagellin family)
MALEKVTVVDRIEVLENGSVQVRTKTAILEDGKQISGSFHRHVVAPGDDYSGEDARVQAICAATHTADVVVAYEAAQAAAQTNVAQPA